jgi:hypothetical protein
MRRVGTTCRRTGEASPLIRRNSVSVASFPMDAGSWAITVMSGWRRSASGKSSKPIRAVRCCRPAAGRARTVPIVKRFWLLNRAVGGHGPVSSPVAAALAVSIARRSCRTRWS